MRAPKSHDLDDAERARYLAALDAALGSLAQNIKVTRHDRHLALLKDFGDKNDWDWARIPFWKDTYKTVSDLVARVQQEYRWFADVEDPADPKRNRVYPGKLGVSAESGLPWAFSMIELHHLRRDAQELLQKMAPYERIAKDAGELLLSDDAPLHDVRARAAALRRTSLERKFYEQVQDATLLGWEQSGFSLPPKATLHVRLGFEELWNVTMIKYDPGSAVFQLYDLDFWQSQYEPHVTLQEGRDTVSAELENALRGFSKDNAAWFMIQQLDRGFARMQPVHVTKCLVGPYENRYTTGSNEIPLLSVTKEMLAEDRDAGILRFSRQYSYAPNVRVAGQEMEQVLYRQDWREEFLVVPGAFAPRVARKIEGNDIQIYEM